MNTQAQIQQLEHKLNQIAKIEVPKASSSALNKVSAKIKTRVISGVSKQTKVQAKLIRKRVYIKRSIVRTQKARISVYAKDISAISLLKNTKLGPLKRQIAGKRIKGVWIADGSKNKGKYNKGHGFSQTSLKHKQVLKRTTKGRYPVEVVKIPIFKVAENVSKKVINRMFFPEFQRLYANDLRYRLSKYAQQT